MIVAAAAIAVVAFFDYRAVDGANESVAKGSELNPVKIGVIGAAVTIPNDETNRARAIGVLDMSAMDGYIGGGGLGNFATAYGYQKFDQSVTWTAVIIMIVLVQVVQRHRQRHCKTPAQALAVA